MAAERNDARERGLPSLNRARAERQRSLRRGTYRLQGQGTLRFWLWAGVILATFGVGYWKVAQGKLESQKAQLMAKQRAVALVLSPTVVPHTDRIERWVAELAGQWRGDFMAPGLVLGRLQERPGIYLRVHAEAAATQRELRRAASDSMLDGFVACLFVRRGEADPRVGPPCESSPDCDPGLLCNEFHVCVPPPRPYNLRLGYSALRVLTSDWTDELHQASNELKLRAFERELERVSKHDVPLAVQMMDKAEIFTAVLDETPPEGLPEKLDGYESVEERVQRVPHWARVGVWEIATGREVLRIRARADGQFIPVGEQHVMRVPGAARTEDQRRNYAAQQRQANGCALALAVKAAVQRGASASARPAGGPAEIPATPPASVSSVSAP